MAKTEAPAGRAVHPLHKPYINGAHTVAPGSPSDSVDMKSGKDGGNYNYSAAIKSQAKANIKAGADAKFAQHALNTVSGNQD